MQVTILLAQLGSAHLNQGLTIISKVLRELEVRVNTVDLTKLAYFNGERTKETNELMEQIKESRGIIALTSVPMLSLHGAMQTFFDNATLYDSSYFNAPILAITYSEWLGEVEAAERILKMWNVLGGNEGTKFCMNKGVAFEEIKERIERVGEDFYRAMKQERGSMLSSERLLYMYLKNGQGLNSLKGGQSIQEIVNEQEQQVVKEDKQEIKSLTDILKRESNTVNLSTKEQTIKEITTLLKQQVNRDEKEDKEEFRAIQTGIYKRPNLYQQQNTFSRYLHQIPHYFIAQYDKDLSLVVRYTITDSNEKGFILIQNGDCQYMEEGDFTPTVDLTMSEQTLIDLMKKRMTYQKAFMLGKLKVKGNFAILPKIDQIFTTM
ncbi:hypothetical protein CS063_12900 [Sporanaerobium hydrogeniformans]|uniref:Uncharacterized protein n=1 Tax=Sporanaerobium hydrogeniformans TaxID=3072179 RepID=A0AC61DBV3_9FIRM|nr:SCP2 sterol-binding domain-containing protein [Sporanaerobium hydrogeniformans]PHV70037.1 hypothetical protein CS063_12900 [Sporanaerobium hydrogeniformans]